MTSEEALDLWNQYGKGKTFWTLEFANAVERETLKKVNWCRTFLLQQPASRLLPAIDAIEACAVTYEMNGLHETAAGIRAILAASKEQP